MRKRGRSVYLSAVIPYRDTDITYIVDLCMDEQDTLPARLTAMASRDYFTNSFVKPEAPWPWQWKHCI
jgi:hypothetical protein